MSRASLALDDGGMAGYVESLTDPSYAGQIDWNHPNRVGHAHIARWPAANPAFKAQCLPN